MASVLELTDVSVVRDGNTILDSVSWAVDSDERWVVLGPNGAGKTTLLSVASASIHPSSGTARVLDDTLGKVDVFELRPRIGFASTQLARRVPESETVLDVVLTAAYSVTGRWNEQYDDIDTRRARRVLAEWKLDHLEERRFGSLSDGEQKRVQIARAVMTSARGPDAWMRPFLSSNAWVNARGISSTWWVTITMPGACDELA